MGVRPASGMELKSLAGTLLVLSGLLLLILAACAHPASSVLQEEFAAAVEFNLPTGLAADSGGFVYVFDSGTNRVLKLSPEGSLVGEFGSRGTEPGQFNCILDRGTICGLALDPAGNLLVIDKGNFRIQKFSPDGLFLASWGSQGSGNGQFVRPIYAAVDAQGNVFVSDDRSARIQKFDSNGEFLLGWGSYGTGDGQFRHATGIAVDSNGNVYISDYENEQVSKFTDDGIFLLSWQVGVVNGRAGVPEAIAVDEADRIFISDSRRNQIEVFDTDGRSLAVLVVRGTGLFDRLSPYGIAVVGDQWIYLSDRNAGRLLRLSLPDLP